MIAWLETRKCSANTLRGHVAACTSSAMALWRDLDSPATAPMPQAPGPNLLPPPPAPPPNA